MTAAPKIRPGIEGVVSLHPHFEGGVNIRLSPEKVFSEAELKALGGAVAVVVPQNVKEDQYRLVSSLCANVFPDYRMRFGFEGKTGNFRLFEKFGLPRADTGAYENAGVFLERHAAGLPFDFPFVVKADREGGGNGVFLIKSRADLRPALDFMDGRPFVAQRFVNHEGADLRVVILGGGLHPYWRIQGEKSEFRNNVGRGASISRDFEPELTARGLKAAGALREKTGINCAAVDILFDRSIEKPAPLLSEINFVFGRKGMDGTVRFRELFARAVDEWTRQL